MDFLFNSLYGAAVAIIWRFLSLEKINFSKHKNFLVNFFQELNVGNFLGFTVAWAFKNILLAYTYVANETWKLLWKVLTPTSCSGRIIYKYITTSTSVTLT